MKGKGKGLKIAEAITRLETRNDREMAELERRNPQYNANPLSIPGIRELSDLGNAERLVDAYGNYIRYCHPTSTWYVWDGRRWAPDNEGKVFSFATEIVRTIYGEACNIEDDKPRRRLASFAIKSETEQRIRGMIGIARSRPNIPILPKQMDADPWKLNVMNGTLDLRTGELHKQDPADLITKLASAEYDPDARSELWDRFLEDVTGGNAAFRQYLARALGVSLLGVASGEEVLFFVYGSTATGKSTFLEAARATLGEYAVTADFSTFLAGKKGVIRSDVVRLAGSRIVLSAESEDGSKLAEGFLKMYTGGDTISGRPLYRKEVEIQQRGMLWLVSNHRPKTDAGDDALWRRMRVLPFEHEVPEEKRDPDVKRTLSDPAQSGAAILAFAVKGCEEWQREGLSPPSCVQVATESYKRDVNPASQFIDDDCELGPIFSCSSADLYEEYTRWAESNGIKFPVRKIDFGKHLKSFGLESTQVGQKRTRTWQGIDLK